MGFNRHIEINQKRYILIQQPGSTTLYIRINSLIHIVKKKKNNLSYYEIKVKY